ncbi:MAG TPA: hypothetical protein VIP46_18610 [Pyrinomonadaceae bacterium]
MFNTEYRKVLDANIPLPLRFRKFLHCLEWHCCLTRQSFHATFIRIGIEFGFDWVNKPDESQLMKAATLLRNERGKFLVKLERFAKTRGREKSQGQRQPRKAQLKDLYSRNRL